MKFIIDEVFKSIKDKEFVNTVFIGCSFRKAKISNSKFVNCEFRDCDLESTEFFRCDLYDIEFPQLDFEFGEPTFKGCVIGKTNLDLNSLSRSKNPNDLFYGCMFSREAEDLKKRVIELSEDKWKLEIIRKAERNEFGTFENRWLYDCVLNLTLNYDYNEDQSFGQCKLFACEVFIYDKVVLKNCEVENTDFILKSSLEYDIDEVFKQASAEIEDSTFYGCEFYSDTEYFADKVKTIESPAIPKNIFCEFYFMGDCRLDTCDFHHIICTFNILFKSSNQVQKFLDTRFYRATIIDPGIDNYKPKSRFAQFKGYYGFTLWPSDLTGRPRPNLINQLQVSISYAKDCLFYSWTESPAFWFTEMLSYMMETENVYYGLQNNHTKIEGKSYSKLIKSTLLPERAGMICLNDNFEIPAKNLYLPMGYWLLSSTEWLYNDVTAFENCFLVISDKLERNFYKGVPITNCDTSYLIDVGRSTNVNGISIRKSKFKLYFAGGGWINLGDADYYFEDCRFLDSKLNFETSGVRLYFINCDFRDSTFYGTWLKSALEEMEMLLEEDNDINEIDFGVEFIGCDLTGADFTKSRNTEVITFENCIFDNSTQLPEDSTILMENT